MWDFKKFVNVLLLLFCILSSKICFANEKFSDELYFSDQNGQLTNIEAFEDNVVILHFWATWCNSCVNEMTLLEKLQKEYKKKPLKIVPISQDYKEVKFVEEFYKKHNFTFLPIYNDPKNILFKELNLPSIPSTILIDKNGMEIKRLVGEVNWKSKDIRDLIDAELAK